MPKFQGAGIISVGKLNLTTYRPASAFRFLGCVDSLEPKFTITKGAAHYERCSGFGQLDYQGIKSKEGSLDLTFTEWSARNIALALNGTIIEDGVPSVAGAETIPVGVENGDYWHLGSNGTDGVSRQAITGLTVEDASTTPQTLVAGTDYELDATYGSIRFLDVSGLVQPFVTNAYGYTIKGGVAVFSATGDEYTVRYNLKNVPDALAKGIAELYRWKPDPIPNLALVSDDFVTFALSGPLFADSTRDIDADWGQFGRILPTLV